MKWKTLASEYLFKDTWLSVRKDTCEISEGKIKDDYYVYEFPTWVTALALTEDNQVVMVKQYRHAIGEVCIEIPGGCVDDDDKNNEDAIARELKEETGFVFSEYIYLGKTSPNPSTNNNWMHMYLAKGGRKVAGQQLDESEEIDVMIVSIDELKEMLKENKIIQAMHVTCIFNALTALGEIKYK
jgi:ADP-ribose pyrophosphatase